jgi:hypothetical protein
MKEFEPLDATDFERELLASAAGDEPSPHLGARVAAAVGIGASALTTASVASGASAAGLLVKYLAIGLAGGILVTVGVAQPWRTAARPAPPASEIAAAPIPCASVADVSAPALAVAPSAAAPIRWQGAPPPPASPSFEPTPEPAAPSVGALPDVEPLPAAAPAPPAARGSLAEEVRALDEARLLLRQGRPAQALALLEGRRAGVLSAEAAVLRVEALLRSGQRAAAEREAAPIIANNPQGLHAARVRALLGTTP